MICLGISCRGRQSYHCCDCSLLQRLFLSRVDTRFLYVAFQFALVKVIIFSKRQSLPAKEKKKLQLWNGIIPLILHDSIEWQMSKTKLKMLTLSLLKKKKKQGKDLKHSTTETIKIFTPTGLTQSWLGAILMNLLVRDLTTGP